MRLPLLAALSLSLVDFALADDPIYIDSKAYDNADFGAYPIQHFKATSHRAPRVNLVRQSDKCAHDLYTFFSPRGFAGNARLAQSTILDQNGHLVWTTGWGENQQMYNLQMQQYKGNKYLTFWAGNDAVGGHGAGKYFMLDQSYKVFKKIEAVNGLQGDLHEFTITEQDTAIITAYKVRDVDLTSLGKTTGPIWECLFQEIDIETGELVFEWLASDHVDVADTYRGIGGEGNPGGAAFDWFHINSIDKDPKGNYLVSSRYLHSVSYVDGGSGDVIWTLGGKKNMFEDLSGGRATNFAFQHDARWANNYTEVTIFDNSDDGGFSDRSHPRGVRIAVDQEAMTAELVAEYKNPTRFSAASQGSMRDLPNGNVLLGFGNAPLYTEFARDGSVLCETHFGPAKKFGSGEAQSYRVLKFAWQGFPARDPELAVDKDDAGLWRTYVSWNGATEIARWVLQGAGEEDAAEDAWEVLDVVPKLEFETSFVMRPEHPDWVRVKAVDASGNVLGVTPPANATEAKVTYVVTEPETDSQDGTSQGEASDDDDQNVDAQTDSQDPEDQDDSAPEEASPSAEDAGTPSDDDADNSDDSAVDSEQATAEEQEQEQQEQDSGSEDHTWYWVLGAIVAGAAAVTVIALSPARRAILGRYASTRKDIDYVQLADQEAAEPLRSR